MCVDIRMVSPMYVCIGLANSEDVLNSKSFLLRNRVGACPGISLSLSLTLTLSFSESAKFGRATLSWAVLRISCSYLNTSSVNWFICQRRMFNLKKSMRMWPNLSQEVEAARVDRLSKCKEVSSLPLGGRRPTLSLRSMKWMVYEVLGNATCVSMADAPIGCPYEPLASSRIACTARVLLLESLLLVCYGALIT